MIDGHPDVVRRFIAAWFQVQTYMKTHKAETVAEIVSHLEIPETVAAADYDTLMPDFSKDGKFSAAALNILSQSFVQMGSLPAAPDMKGTGGAFAPRRSNSARMKRRSLIGSAVAATVAATSAASGAPARGTLELQEQGTFYVSGDRQFRTPNSSLGVGDVRSLPGEIAVNQMYVEYQIPVALKYRYPLVLRRRSHRGYYRTTPDGREGWFTSFTRRGFAVYAVDAPNRGRAGWDPTHRLAVTAGLEPPAKLEPANIYSAQSAWVAFRWGPTYDTPYPNTQFPLDHVDDYINQIQAAYRDAAQNPLIHRGLEALVDKIGPCILLGWSTGTGNVMVAGSKRPGVVKGVIGLEVFPGAEGNNPVLTEMAKVPFLGIMGDNLDPSDGRKFTQSLVALGGNASSVFLPDVGIHGNGHTMAIEKNNEAIADLIQRWIDTHAR